mmetsp:Transcript_19179/g.35030  ORF Transcript_19179/g.35030 Transcript_19179/m.35030 type:complete len:215 (+) Transcript_19179:1477-2121(+)
MEVKPKLTLLELIEDYTDLFVAACVGLYLCLVSSEMLGPAHWYCIYVLQVPLCYFYVLNKRTFSVVRWEAFVKSTCFTRDFDLLKHHDPQTYYNEMIKLLRIRLKCPLLVSFTPEGATVKIRSWQPSDLTMYLWIVCNPFHLLVAKLSAGLLLYQVTVSLFFAIEHTLVKERLSCQQALAELVLFEERFAAKNQKDQMVKRGQELISQLRHKKY